MDLKFRTVKQFHPDKPDALGRELSDFERNVDEALDRAEQQVAPAMTITNRKTATCSVALDEVVIADTALGSFAVTMPVATAKNAGHYVGIVRPSAANTLTAAPVSGLVMGAASDTVPAAIGLYLYMSDGTGWWRR